MSNDFLCYTDIGTVIKITVVDAATLAPVVLTGATGITIEVKKPSGSTTQTSWTATVGSDPTTLEHTITAGDISDAIGDCVAQPKFTLGSWSGRCQPIIIKVNDLFA